MATGRLRAQRHLVIAQASLVWGTFSAADLAEFIRCGELKAHKDRIPSDPVSADFAAQIEANDGKLDFAKLTVIGPDGNRVLAFPPPGS